MAVIVYKKYTFTAPGRISPDQYGHYKIKLATDPGFSLDSKAGVRFTGHFRKRLIWMTGGLLTGLLFLAIFMYVYPEKATSFEWQRLVLMAPVFIGGAIVVFTFVPLLLEGPSFATYLTDKYNYFTQLRHNIRNSANYQAFCDTFYTAVINNKPDRKAISQETQQTPQLAPQGIDKVLTNTFYWIDKHYWKVFLVAVALFLLNKYVFKWV